MFEIFVSGHLSAVNMVTAPKPSTRARPRSPIKSLTVSESSLNLSQKLVEASLSSLQPGHGITIEAGNYRV
jgi:hypothetical protein